jgi:charged multivesicular body protein 5
MKRILGVGKKPAPAPSLADTCEVLEKRGDHLDAKIQKLDKELLGYKEQMAKLRPGPAQNRIKQKAMQTLKQKKMYEQQREVLSNQQWNMDQLQFTTETTKATIEQVNVMKESAKVLKKEMKKMDISSIEDLQDELADLYEDSNEIQEIMGRAYGVPEDIDEDDLEAELAALGDEMADTDGSYLDEALSTPARPQGEDPKPEEETDPDRLEQQLGL